MPQAAVSVIMNAEDGKIITTLPIGTGVDGAGFMPKTREAFSSQGDGTLTVIKEKSPIEFEVEQTLTTMPSAKTMTIDSKTRAHLPDRRTVRRSADRRSWRTAAPWPAGSRFIYDFGSWEIKEVSGECEAPDF